jgi:hypothetical protein
VPTYRILAPLPLRATVGKTTFEIHVREIGSTWGGWDLYVRDVASPSTNAGYYCGRYPLEKWERLLYTEGHDLGPGPSVPLLAFDALVRDGKAERCPSGPCL